MSPDIQHRVRVVVVSMPKIKSEDDLVELLNDSNLNFVEVDQIKEGQFAIFLGTDDDEHDIRQNFKHYIRLD
jgi:DNA-binding LacI/PurR family transcriptional regulator